MSGEGDERGREFSRLRRGGEDAFIYGGSALTALWQRCPRQCLLEFQPVTQDRDTNQHWSQSLPQERGSAFRQLLKKGGKKTEQEREKNCYGTAGNANC